MEADTSYLNKFSYFQFWQLVSLSQICSFILHELCPPTQSALFKIEELKDQLSQNSFDLAKIKQDKTPNQQLGNSLSDLENCLEFIKDLLVFGRSQQTVLESIKLSRVVERVFAILDFKAKDAKVKLHVTGPKDLILTTHPFLLHLTLTNLVLNAIEAYEQKPTRSTTSLPTRIKISFSQKKNKVLIRVKDWAGGIAPEKAKQIFEPFFTSKNQDCHWGLGLTITKQFVENKLQGKLELETTFGQDTCFTIILPQEISTACLV
ncbi:MAG: GHKL domain-containing protein [Candidatus Pacebacteria bacterium]|nr:GHKL domain-containing protein [Candidatus Paceibacterota bacterium]